MRKLITFAAVAAIGLGSAASAHPTNILFDSFGECNAALNQQNKSDRERVGSFFPSNGAAEVSMLNNWQCVYDTGLDAWHMEGQPAGGNNLGNGNGKADPGNPA